MQSSAVAASLPEIARHTGMGIVRSPWILVIYALVLSCSMISLCRLGDAVGVGTGMLVSANGQAITSCTPAEIQGTATAMLAAARNLGVTLGVPIAAAMYPLQEHRLNAIRSSMFALSSLACLNVLICGLVQSSGASQRAVLLIQPSSR